LNLYRKHNIKYEIVGMIQDKWVANIWSNEYG